MMVSMWAGVPLVIITLIFLVYALRMQAAKIRLETELVSTRKALESAQTNERLLADDWKALGDECAELRLDKVRLEEQGNSQQEKLAWLEASKEKLKIEFEQLSGRIFEERTQKLQQGNKEGLELLLKPFRDQLKEFRERVDRVHTEGSETQAALRQQLSGLKELNLRMQEDARHLTQALRGENKTQGNWGEMILERLLEESGLQQGREYETQSSHRGEEGNLLRPDVVIHLPDQKDIVIDSKVSLKAYEAFCQGEAEEDRQAALKQHLDSVRAHIKGLASKDYQSLKSVNSLDFVLLFIPVEGAFVTAIQADADLFTQAFEKNVVLVSPSTLLVTLRTIRHIWRFEDQSRNALEIADRAGGICDQVALLEEAWKEVGERLGKAQGAWETGYKRLSQGKGNLLRQAQQLKDMGAKAKRNLPAPTDDEG